MTKILGLSGSLRNARKGKGNESLIDDLKKIKSEKELKKYLQDQAAIHLQHFVDAGRKEKLPFDQIYTNLKKNKGNTGLSNSEVALALKIIFATIRKYSLIIFAIHLLPGNHCLASLSL